MAVPQCSSNGTCDVKLQMSKWRLEDFLEPVWTGPNDFLAKYRDHFSDLRTFAEALSSFTESLKSNLTTIIHDDYTEFVSISRHLLQLGDHMGGLIKLLRACERDIANAAKSREASTRLLRTQSESLKKVKHEHAVCSIALEAVENLEKIEQRMAESAADPFSLMDVAVGFSVTRAKLSVLDQPSDRKPIEGDFDRLHEQFCALIGDQFCTCVKDRNVDSLAILVDAVVVGGVQNVLYDSYGSVFLGALFEEIEETLKSNRGIRANCQIVFEKVFEYMNNEESDFEFVKSNSGDSFDFMANSFWPRVAAFMDRRLSFPIGSVPEQKSSYLQWNEFVSACESRCNSVEAVIAIRNSIEFRNITNKLGLNVYAQLVSREICDEAESVFNQNIQVVSGGEFHLDIFPKLIECYSKLFGDELFIIDQAKDFAVVAMKLIASLSSFAESSAMNLLPFFVVDLGTAARKFNEATPEFLRSAMKLAMDSLTQTSERIRERILDDIAAKCIEHLKYIETMTVVSVQSQKSRNASPKATAAIRTYTQWMSSEGAVISGPETLGVVAEKLLQAFYEKAESTLKTIQRDLETISRFRKNPGDGKDSNALSLDGVKAQLKRDFDYITNVIRGGKVAVDSMPVFQKIVDLLELEQK